MRMPIVLFCLLIWGSACTDTAQDPSLEADSTVHATGTTHVLAVPPQVQEHLRTEVVARRDIPQIVTAPGEVALDLTRVADVSSRIEGQVERLFVKLGDRVERGQPLVAIGSLKLDELVQQFLVSRVEFAVARKNFLRTKNLLAERVVSERRFLEDRSRYLQAKAVYQHITEKLRNMGLTATELQELVRGTHVEGHRYLLKSPLQGIVTDQSVVLGQGIRPGDQLFRVVDTDHVWVFANLPVEQAQQFQPGARGIIVPKGRDPIDAVLGYVAPVADKRTLTVRLRFDVDNSTNRLLPHEYVDVRLHRAGTSAVAIPRSALTLIDGRQGVFVQRRNGYAFVPVTLGRQSEAWVEVLNGVTEGDTVVTQGVFDLKNALLRDSIQGE